MVLEGVGFVTGELTITIDGLAVDPKTIKVHTTTTLGEIQQVADLIVPAGVGAGVITATTTGDGGVPPRLPGADGRQYPRGGRRRGHIAAQAITLVRTRRRRSPGRSATTPMATAMSTCTSSRPRPGTSSRSGARTAALPVMRLFDASGTQLAIGEYNNNPSIFRFAIPADGTYYLGVSGYSNTTYNPKTPPNSGSRTTAGHTA